MRRSTAAILFGAALLAAVAAAPAAAEDPGAALKAALDRTAGARSAKIALTQKATTAGRTLETRVEGSLAGSDSDIVVNSERGRTQRVSVGAEVAERELDRADATWRRSARPAPERATPFAALVLADGTPASDPRLYRSITDAGTVSLPQGEARMIVADVDTTALAAAMRLAPAEAARVASWRATLTAYLAADGTVLRHALTIELPGNAGPTTLETTIDLSELDAPLSITPP